MATHKIIRLILTRAITILIIIRVIVRLANSYNSLGDNIIIY